MTCIKTILADLFETHYLFEIYQTSVTNKSSENVVISGCLERPLHWRAPTVF